MPGTFPLNIYAYVRGNPISLIDPLGLTECDVDVAYAIAMELNPDLNFGTGRPIMDLPGPREFGETFHAGEAHRVELGGDGYIHLSEFFAPELGDHYAAILFRTVIHEGLHFTLPLEIQSPADNWNHSYIEPEAQWRADAGREAFLNARKVCSCP